MAAPVLWAPGIFLVLSAGLVAHDCGYPLSRYTCRATRVAAHFLDFIAFCRCSTGVALHPLKIWVSHLSPPPFPGGVAPKFGSEKVSRYTGVSQLQLRVSRYTVQLSLQEHPHAHKIHRFWGGGYFGFRGGGGANLIFAGAGIFLLLR